MQFSTTNTSNIEQKIADSKDFLLNTLALPANKMNIKIESQKMQIANKQVKQDTYLYF